MSDSSNHNGPASPAPVNPAHVLVFDSGVGGLSVLQEIVKLRPDLRFSYAADNAAFPYGLKTETELIIRVSAVVRALVDRLRPDILVIACNTASTTALDAVRHFLPIPVIGVVPAVKPAAASSRTRIIGLLGTNATIASPYTHRLIADFAGECGVIPCGAPELVEAAERKIQGLAADMPVIRKALDRMFTAPGGDRIDTVVLGCTHFPLLGPELAEAAPRPIIWMDSGAAIARRVNAILGAGGPAVHAPPEALALFTAETPLIERMRSGLEAFGITKIDCLEVKTG